MTIPIFFALFTYKIGIQCNKIYATEWIIKKTLHFKLELELVLELLFIIFSPLGRFGYKYNIWSFSPLQKPRTRKYETKNALIRDPSMTIFVYF